MVTAVGCIEEPLPAIDERLALPEAGYEILDGVVTFVVPSDPPHGERHATVAVLIRSHVSSAFKVAIDMPTRTSKIDDVAPDISVFPRAPDRQTGGRQLEQLVFEIVSTEAMSTATRKAAKLADRGVRRLFAIDLERGRVVEWSRERADWVVLEPASWIEDPALAVPLPVAALLDAIDTDDEVARALVARNNPVIESFGETSRAGGLEEGWSAGRQQGWLAGVARGQAEAILRVLAVRNLLVSESQRERILAEREATRLTTWLDNALRCDTVDQLLDGEL